MYADILELAMKIKLKFILILQILLFCLSISVYAESDNKEFHLPIVEQIIAKWTPSGGSELGSSQSFIMELCALIGVEHPASPRSKLKDNTYLFEKAVTLTDKNGKKTQGRIDLYKRGAFIWESKQGSYKSKDREDYRTGTAVRETKGWDKAMIAAKDQAENYARSLPPEEGHPPFLIIADIGYTIEIYADFHNSGIYIPFPSARDNRITLSDLRRDDIRDRLYKIWTDPLSLDPSRENERVTNEVALKLSYIADSLEKSGYDTDTTTLFIIRCIFVMFAEDCNLLPYGSFTKLLYSLENNPEKFLADVNDLWATMKTGGNSKALGNNILNFGGILFDNAEALPLNELQIELLREAAKANWSAVDTSIFGTLLQKALSTKERHKLGAHYTPTAYVERLVIPTVIDPIRAEWNATKKSALSFINHGDHTLAINEIEAFHKRLSETIILDPSSGSGNFLAVSLNLLKDVEDEVVQALRDLGQTDTQIKAKGYSVSTKQFKGIEYLPRAAAVSELVLWITALQRHYKSFGNVNPSEPVLSDFKSIECRDALLGWEAIEFVRDSSGKVITRWDGETYTTNNKTRKEVPDTTAVVPIARYINPRPADSWPKADYIVGNPPFIGSSKMRQTLGDGYTEALRKVYPDIPKNVDYVMYWWDIAAELVRDGKVKRFGFITTNGIRRINNRKVVEKYLYGDPKISIVMAIPDHPWIKGKNSAQVRIAMTAAELGDNQGILYKMSDEKIDNDSDTLALESSVGAINADLTQGADATKAKQLKANDSIASQGVIINGNGFLITQEEAALLGLGSIPGLEQHIKPYISGKDIASKSRNLMVIDLYGLDIETVQHKYPAVYQWILERVKPFRDQNNVEKYKTNWWFFNSNTPLLSLALKMDRYIVTPGTARRRYFTFVDAKVLPGAGVVSVASEDAYILGILSSRIHTSWILATGGYLGVGNDSVYVKSICFDAFPFPDATEKQKQNIRKIAEEIDKHRKERQEKYQELTLTDIYRVMDNMNNGEFLSQKDESIKEKSDLLSLIKLHNDLDFAVSEAYGWPDNLSDAEILFRLLKLNQVRIEEEKAGKIRYLRPEFQKHITK